MRIMSALYLLVIVVTLMLMVQGEKNYMDPCDSNAQCAAGLECMFSGLKKACSCPDSQIYVGWYGLTCLTRERYDTLLSRMEKCNQAYDCTKGIPKEGSDDLVCRSSLPVPRCIRDNMVYCDVYTELEFSIPMPDLDYEGMISEWEDRIMTTCKNIKIGTDGSMRPACPSPASLKAPESRVELHEPEVKTEEDKWRELWWFMGGYKSNTLRRIQDPTYSNRYWVCKYWWAHRYASDKTANKWVLDDNHEDTTTWFQCKHKTHYFNEVKQKCEISRWRALFSSLVF